jgi:hypothetical protein
MKNLHFYIQSVMLIFALSIAVQIPFRGDFFFAVVCVEFFLGVYQLMMSCLLMRKLSYRPLLLQLHFFGTWAYLVLLIVLGMNEPTWMDDGRWTIALYIIPWAFAILFLVSMDEMERFRDYRL